MDDSDLQLLNDPVLIGQRLKMLRDHRNQSQVEAASFCGISQPQWSKLERGDFTKTSMLSDIARAYNVNADWLELGIEPQTVNGAWVRPFPSAAGPRPNDRAPQSPLRAAELQIGYGGNTKQEPSPLVIDRYFSHYRDPLQAWSDHGKVIRALKSRRLNDDQLSFLAGVAQMLLDSSPKRFAPQPLEK